ncbi:MAG: thiamine pyrophosphate-binding protein [Burkholderiales bacterium]|nr:thiamine pyrophosphate-binding protein [Burkholderiales bacterium]
MAGNRGADLLCQTLKTAGIRRIFTLSGNHIMPVFDAALDAGIELVHVRHEAACVHMADAYARLTGAPAVALVTGGPGHANAVGALYTAQMAEAPVVLLSGHAPNDQIGLGAFQEMRQAEMAAPVAKASWTSAGADALGTDIARALGIARAGRPGPVHLSLPTDALDATTEVAVNIDAAHAAPAVLPDQTAATIMSWLAGGARPLVLTGPEAMQRAGNAARRALADAAGVPVVGMESPRGTADPSLGAFAQMLALADRVLLVGKRVDFTLRFGKALSAACEVMQIDTESLEHTRARRAFGERLRLSTGADALPALAALTRHATRAASGWRAEVDAAIAYRPPEWDVARAGTPERLHPVEACRPLQALLDTHPDAVLVSDGGEFGQWAQACLSAPSRVINGVAGAIGAGLPFALAARLARPGAPVVALMGDGTFGFHAMEIDTAMRYRLPFVAVVGNDARWNAEYQIQLRAYGPQRLVGCELAPSRYDRLAAALGGHGELVTAAGELAGAARRALASGLPAVLNVMIDGAPAPQVTRAGP